MSYGKLHLPVIYEAGVTVGDPLLDVLLDFFSTCINHYSRAAWSATHPSSEPSRNSAVIRNFAFEPNRQTKYSDKDLPALFLHREQTDPTEKWGGDFAISRSTLCMTWLHPSTPSPKGVSLAAFWNVVDKVTRIVATAGKDPCWVVPGDTYYSPDFYGSSVLHHTNLVSLKVKQAKPEKVIVEEYDVTTKNSLSYHGATIRLEVVERAAVEDIFQAKALLGVQATFKNTTETTPLILQLATYGMRIASLSTTSGSSSGGEVVSLYGTGFVDGATVTFGGTAATVEFVSTNELKATTPAHAAGTVEVVATNPGGESFSLGSVFTFT